MSAPSETVGANNWGVSVEMVSALAPSVPVAMPTGQPPLKPSDPFYDRANTRKLNSVDVQGYITSAASRVMGRVYYFSKLKPEHPFLEHLKAAGADATANAAAAYLVEAAMPMSASPNNLASYGQVLWARYAELMDELVEALDKAIESEKEEGQQAAGPGKMFVSAPPPRFSDREQF